MIVENSISYRDWGLKKNGLSRAVNKAENS